jgi:hypothetical protein
MRHKTGIVCVVAALAVAACSWGNGSGSSNPGVDAFGGNAAVCGDNVCAATEVNNCPQDCGSGGNNNQAVCGNGTCETSKGESATSCPSDCNTNTGSNGGSNTGSGAALNCQDPTTLLACFTCLSGGGCTGVDMNSCNTCLGGSGLGSGTGSGACNFNGMCDAGEDASTCPTDCM